MKYPNVTDTEHILISPAGLCSAERLVFHDPVKEILNNSEADSFVSVVGVHDMRCVCVCVCKMSHIFWFLQQLLKIRDDLKQREMELEKSAEDKQQLESQIQSLKERIQAFPASHTLPVSNTHAHTHTRTEYMTHLSLSHTRLRGEAVKLQ